MDGTLHPPSRTESELGAHIIAEAEGRPHRQTQPSRRRKPKRPGVPREVREEVTQFARQLNQRYGKLLKADPTLRDRVARVFRSMLPPRRKRGRPGDPIVTKAMLLIRKLRRNHPEQTPQQHWQQVYRQVIPNYQNLSREQQRGQETLLREQVRSRRNQQRKQKGTYKSSTQSTDGR